VLLELELAALNLGEVQEVVDQGHEQLATVLHHLLKRERPIIPLP